MKAKKLLTKKGEYYVNGISEAGNQNNLLCL